MIKTDARRRSIFLLMVKDWIRANYMKRVMNAHIMIQKKEKMNKWEVNYVKDVYIIMYA